MSEERVYKILLLGDSMVGKTCFLLKYTDKSFQEIHMSTIGLDYRLKTLTLKNRKTVKLQIWDTAGQDRFRSITKNYYKKANGIILIYDVTNKKSYKNISVWINQIKEEADPNVVIYLAGNKIDMEEERKIKTEEGEKLAEEYNFPFKETSAKEDININETFEDLVEIIDEEFSKSKTDAKIKIKENRMFNDKKKNKGCC